MKKDSVTVTIKQLLESEATLGHAQGRGNIPTNHAIARNLDKVKTELKAFREAQKLEPMVWAFWDQINPERPKSKKGEDTTPQPKKPTKKQIEEGQKALEEYLALEVEYRPYRVSLSKCADDLRKFPGKREFLDDEELENLRVNFSVVLGWLGILGDEE